MDSNRKVHPQDTQVSTSHSLLDCPKPNCGRSFKNLTGLRSHIKSQHPTIPSQHTRLQFPYTPGTRNRLQPETVLLTGSKPHYPYGSPLTAGGSDSESPCDGSPSKEDNGFLAGQSQGSSLHNRHYPSCSPLNDSDSQSSSENNYSSPLDSPILPHSLSGSPSINNTRLDMDEGADYNIFMDTDQHSTSLPRSDDQDQERSNSESEPVVTRLYHPKINGT